MFFRQAPLPGSRLSRTTYMSTTTTRHGGATSEDDDLGSVDESASVGSGADDTRQSDV